MSIEESILKFNQKQLPSERQAKKKREAPEKLVEKEVMKWLRENSFDVDVVSNEAVHRQTSARRHLDTPTTPGFSDICGNDKDGRAVFIELKALGKRSALSWSQRKFLDRKIDSGCFAVCVDSVDLLKEFYVGWLAVVKHESAFIARFYLKNILPKMRKTRSSAEFQRQNPDIPF